MTILEFFRRVGSLLHRRRIDAGLDEEMRQHVELATAADVAAGLDPDEARRRVLAQFGNSLSLREEGREAWGFPAVESVLQDVRYAARILRKSPGFTAAIVLSLALGIGANAAIFSLIDAVLLRMLPLRNPGQLAHLTVLDPVTGPNDLFSYPAFQDFQKQKRVFSGVLAFSSLNFVNVEVNSEGALARGQLVSGDYFSVLGVPALLGRTIEADDDRAAGGGPVAVLSFGYWQQRFGGDPRVIGEKIAVNGAPFTIIGVTPPAFRGLQPGREVDISVPMTMVAQVFPMALPGTRSFILTAPFRTWVEVIGRLQPGVRREQAEAALAPVFQQQQVNTVAALAGMSANTPQVRQEFLGTRLRLEDAGRGLPELRRQFARPLLLLMAMVAVLLLLACANVAGLLLARARKRTREIALRAALGARRMRMVRQLLTESLLLAVAASAVGLALAYWGDRSLLALLAQGSKPVALSVSPDLRVLGFTAAVALVTAILFGLAPAWRATQIELAPSLKTGGAAAEGPHHRSRLGSALVAAQVALSLVLLVGAGLVVRSLQHLEQFDPGFNQEKVLLFSIDPSLAGFGPGQLEPLYRDLLQRVSAAPGVQSASFSMYSPLSEASQQYANTTVVPSIVGYRHDAEVKTPIQVNVIGPGYFGTLQSPVLQGREFESADSATSVKVAVINRSMAELYFGGLDAVGRSFSMPGFRNDSTPLRIVGVVQDSKAHDLREAALPTAYVPFSQAPFARPMTFEVRTLADPASATATLRRTIRDADSRLSLYDVKTLRQLVDGSFLEERLLGWLASLFGAVALTLVAIGLYALISYGVASRTREIGVRMALGAQSGQVLRMILGGAAAVTGAGIVAGLAASLASTRLLRSFLFQVGPLDVGVFTAVAVLLSVVGIGAALLPARRAAHVDPAIALRAE